MNLAYLNNWSKLFFEFFFKKIKASSSKASDTKSELLEICKGKRMGKKKSLLEAMEKKKPMFDPSQHKSFEKYFEEYYKLDFEDFVGDTPCRFKYRKVVPNDFGLTTEEVRHYKLLQKCNPYFTSSFLFKKISQFESF